MVLAVLGITVQAEELKFITVMSQPIGAVAKLEALNEKRPAEAFFVNFCNENVSYGSIHSYGRVTMNELRLMGNDVRVGSEETGDDMSYQITKSDGLIVQGKGSLAGAKLLAAEANPDKIEVDATVQINSNTKFYQANIPSMLINGTTKIAKNTTNYKDKTLSWSGDYTRDYKVGSGGIEATGSLYNSKLLRVRLATGGVCAGAPSMGATARIIKCSDRFGSNYTGQIAERYNFTTCAWEETSNNCTRGDLKWQLSGYKTDSCTGPAPVPTQCSGNKSPEGANCNTEGAMCYTVTSNSSGNSGCVRQFTSYQCK